MAAITLLLLWLFQFLFFELMYYDRQEAHLNDVCADIVSYDYNRPDSWSELETIAQDQNLNIYVFLFNKNNVHEDQNGNYMFPDECSISLYTPHYSSRNTSINIIEWSEERINDYLNNVKNLDETKTFTYFEDKEIDSLTDILIYGGELNGEFGSNVKAYFCMIASISTTNFTVTLMQNMLLVATVVIFVISIIMSLLFTRQLSKPINRLAATANQLATGDFNVNFESKSFVEVEQLAASLNYAKEELSKTDQMRRDFIANVSHDLRTPLTMIRAYAEMIRDLSGRNEEKRTKHCQIIIDESNRLSLLVGDIQNLSKLQSGTDTFNFSRFDLSELCKTVITRFSIMSETQGYEFNTELADGTFCQGDYQKIEQVLYNLIGNALNYTGEDKKITVRCFSCNDGYKVEIIDTGKGIDPEEIDSVWDRYYRANQKKRNIVGSGLGLNIVKIILTGHDAKHGIQSELNKGTCFWFILPKAK